jgi:hypothetical protein
MPRLSLWRDQKSRDYSYFDRTIKEQFVVGGTDLYVHKYLGPQTVTGSQDLTQPNITETSVTKIQDLLWLENRDRKYEDNIYRIRGHYNTNNLDFDLSQFGLFLNNDIIFVTVHYNDMIDLIGRKLMVGDVFELPHLTDYHPLNETIPIGLRRYYQITDANYASEGFSATWWPHLWRIKAEPLVNSEEFTQIMTEPINKDNWLGEWDPNKTYVIPPGQTYTITYAGKIYEITGAKPGGTTIPPGTLPTDPAYWKPSLEPKLQDIISTYNKNIEINDAAIAEAKRLTPLGGYDRSQLYIVPTNANNTPEPPVNIQVTTGGPPEVARATVEIIRNQAFRNSSSVIRISAAALQSIWNMTADAGIDMNETINKFIRMNLSTAEIRPEITDSGSGALEGTMVLTARALGDVTGPYGTADNTYSNADQDPTPGVPGAPIPTAVMDYRADCDPRFVTIKRASPRTFGYTVGYLAGTAAAPNGEPTGMGITFPLLPEVGDYFLRTDYLPQQLFRWDGALWIKISENVRASTTGGVSPETQLGTFIDNNARVATTSGGTIPSRQGLSQALRIQPD